MRSCFECGNNLVEKHHVFFGTGQRKISEKHGFKVDLCSKHHRGQPEGIHGGNRELDLKLKCMWQRKFEETRSREEFIKLIGRSYL